MWLNVDCNRSLTIVLCSTVTATHLKNTLFALKKNVVEIIFLPFPIYCTGIPLSPQKLDMKLRPMKKERKKERKK